MDDLVKRLRDWETVHFCDAEKPEGSLYVEAAARIEALEARIAKADALAEVASECHLYVEELRCGENLSEALEAYRAARESDT